MAGGAGHPRPTPPTAQAFAAAPAAELAADYLAGRLPPVAQMAVAIFLHQYGMRGPGEIDIGRPRWREQPEPIMQVLQSYLAIDDPANAPDAVFAPWRARRRQRRRRNWRRQCEERAGGPVKARLVRWAIGRYRALGGLREAPKFFAIRYMGIVRQGLLAQRAADWRHAGMLERGGRPVFLDHTRTAGDRERSVTSVRALRERVAERRAAACT